MTREELDKSMTVLISKERFSEVHDGRSFGEWRKLAHETRQTLVPKGWV
jgi:hypothetical protein